jgi:hypothetical protein
MSIHGRRFRQRIVYDVIFFVIFAYDIFLGSRDSSVGIVTLCGLDGKELESRLRRDFPHPSRSAMGPTHPPARTMGTGSLSRG